MTGGWPGRTAFCLIAAVGVFALGACGSEPVADASERTVTKAENGSSWPLTVDEITLHCELNMVTGTTQGKTYAINGSAKGEREEHGWRDLSEIWADDPNVAGLKKDVSGLIQQRLEL